MITWAAAFWSLTLMDLNVNSANFDREQYNIKGRDVKEGGRCSTLQVMPWGSQLHKT